LICSFNFLIFLAVCLNISIVINIKILTNSNQQTQSYKFTSHISAFLSVVLIPEMLEICIQTSYDQNVQLILKSYLPLVYGTPLIAWLKERFDDTKTLDLLNCLIERRYHRANQKQLIHKLHRQQKIERHEFY
jgi:hypothetical protein